MISNIKRLKEIIKLLEESKFNEIELEENDFKIRVKKGGSELISHLSHPPNIKQIHSETPKGLPGPKDDYTEIELTEGRAIIKSPLVGTFYRAPSPNAPVFVNIGDTIKTGQVLCIIEAMKLMNEVECDRLGRVAAILVENAQPVEYGEPLFIIEIENN